ncbi:MAG: hypothetical protein EHM24_33155 [Acidobacteria bacterium]|nr:MAG: hypothetical protein EHM24_33155 [Acidobacteriota bacterium]RPJ78301.1 MAG: hypothetical protein EHM13_14825 [Acidobacteriota bacterium]
MAAILTFLAVVAFWESGVLPQLYRPDRLDHLSISAGRAIQEIVPPGEMMVVVDYEQAGNNSPVLLYHSRRRGWSLDVESVSPQVLERLHRQFRADYFATTVWSDLEARRPEVVDYLRAHRRVEVPGAPHEMAIFRLE